MTTPAPQGPGADEAARRAAAAAARSASAPRSSSSGRSGSSGVRPGAGSPSDTVIRPTAAQRALVPLTWGPAALVVGLLLPSGPVVAVALAVVVAVVVWLLAGRSAVVLTPDALVVRRPVGRAVLPLADVRSVDRSRPVLTERAEVVRADGRRLPLPAPQSGPLAALRDPAFDERLTLIRYRVAKGAPPAGRTGGRP